jgi:hypothetical protein
MPFTRGGELKRRVVDSFVRELKAAEVGAH